MKIEIECNWIADNERLFPSDGNNIATSWKPGQIINSTRKSCIVNGRRWFPAASGRKGRGFPFNRDSAIEQKPASLNSQVHRKAGGKNRAPCCLRNRIDGTVFQAVRSPGNINYKRKEQWKTFHPPDPLSPRAPSSPLAPVHSDICLDDGTRAPCFRRRWRKQSDGEFRRASLACEMKEGEKEDGKMEERRRCSRSGQPTVTETLRRRPTLFYFRAALHVPPEFLNSDYHFRAIILRDSTRLNSFSLTFLYLIHSCFLLFSLYPRI